MDSGPGDEMLLLAVAVWQKPQGFRGDGDIAAWLWGIATRRLVSRLRTRGVAAAVFEKAATVPAAEDQVLLSVEYAWLGLVSLLATHSGSPDAIVQGRAQAGFLVLAASSFVIFLIRRRRLRQLRPWG